MDIFLIILGVLAIIFIIAGLSIANFADSQLAGYYDELSNEIAYLNKSASDFCNIVSKQKFGGKLTCRINTKIFGGSYSPSKNVIELSNEAYYSGSLSAITVVAHELGHAVQFKKEPQILIKNYRLGRIVKLLGTLIFPLLASSVVLLFLNYIIISIILAGLCVVFFITALCMKISTINIEKQASKYALELLTELDAVSDEQYEKAKKLLNYAKLTYTADFFRALLFWTFLTRKTKIF